jgi:cell division transport system ATP-binding protein
MVSLESVTKHFGSNRVFSHLSIDIPKGSFLYLVGGTGAGKTSLLKLLSTEEQASSGRISLFGQNLKNASNDKRQSLRRLIGYIPQDVRLIPDLTVFDNVALSFITAGKSIGKIAKVEEMLNRLGLGAKKNVQARLLSGGEAQRVAVARALVRNPDMIIADEPTGSQDRDHSWMILSLLLKANQEGATVIFATHDIDLVRKVRKPCALLKDGKITLEDDKWYS